MWRSDAVIRRGQQQQSARCQAERDAAIDREIAEARERRLDLFAWARRHGYVIRYRHAGLPGTDLVPYAVRPGAPDGDPGLSAVPGNQRR